MRSLVLGFAAAGALGLAPAQQTTLIIATIGMVAGLVALVWCVVNYLAIRRLTKDQDERIERLQPPTGS